MKTKTIGLIALVVASLSMSGLAQTPVFLSGTATPAAAVADAQTYLSNPTYAVQARTLILMPSAGELPGTTNLTGSSVQALAASIIADKTQGGLITGTADQETVFQMALTAAACASATARASLLTTYASNPVYVAAIRKASDWWVIETGINSITDPSAQIAYINGVAGNMWATPDYVMFPNMLNVMYGAELKVSGSAALQWSKVVYFNTPFADSQKGIGAVATALRVADQSLPRSAAFVQFNKDGTGTNILASIATPSQFSGITVYDPVLQYELAGDHVNAIKTAYAGFIAATDTASLNAGVAKVAQALRNADGNLIRANNFVNAMQAGSNYTIAELSE